MNGRCPNCQEVVHLGGGRGRRVSDHQCLKCHVPLEGITTGRAKGEYLCPITGFVTTLGLTGVELDEPMVLVFRPGWDPILRYRNADAVRTDPGRLELEQLARVAGRILGPGCVIADTFDPHQYDDADAGFRQEQADRAGVSLIPAPDPGDPSAWMVNEKITRRACKGCGARVIDEPDRHVPEPWTPRRTYVPKGRFQHKPVQQGPHPADSVACRECDPRVGDSR